MKNTPPDGPVAAIVRDLVEGMGYTLLEFSARPVKKRTHVHCVIHGPEGIDLDTLGDIHRALEPRLEEALDDRDLRIEFSSPGIERTLKSFHELQAFIGNAVDVLAADSDEWTRGTVTAFSGDTCEISDADGGLRRFSAGDLTKVRLAE